MFTTEATSNEIGTVYLLHLSQPLSPNHTSRHYAGFAINLKARMQHHRKGTGARFTQVAVERGIDFEVVKTWAGTRSFERRLKNGKNLRRYCSVCTVKKECV